MSNLLQDILQLNQRAERAEKIDRRMERVSHCGSYAQYFSASNGLETIRYECGMFRLCEMCLAKRIGKFRDRIDRAVSETNDRIFVFTVTGREKVELVRNRIRHNDIEYLRLPTSKDAATFFVEASNAERNRLFHEFRTNWVESSDILTGEGWEHVATTPEGLRTSGDLGKVEQDEEEKANEIAFQVSLIKTDAPPDARKVAERKAFEVVPVQKFGQVTQSEIDIHQQNLSLRTAAYIAKLSEDGHAAFELTTFNDTVEIGKLLVCDGGDHTDNLPAPEQTLSKAALAFWDYI